MAGTDSEKTDICKMGDGALCSAIATTAGQPISVDEQMAMASTSLPDWRDCLNREVFAFPRLPLIISKVSCLMDMSF